MADEVVTTTGIPDPVEPPPIEPPAPDPVVDPPTPPVEPPADPDAPPPVVARTRPNLQERISRLTAERDEARRIAADAVAAREAAVKPPEPPAPEPPPQEAARPLREQFDAPEEFEAALVEWSSERAARRALNQRDETDQQRRAREDQARTQEQEQAATREQIKKIADTWGERRAKFIETHPDFAEIAEASPEDGGPVINVAMGHIILTDERGPDIALYLGENPDESRRIANMTAGVYPPGHELAGQPAPDVARVHYELGKIVARLEVATAPSVSRAPAPITPIRSNGGTGEKDPNDETMEEYARRRNSELAARNRPGAAMH